jgi:hypothetical protein
MKGGKSVSAKPRTVTIGSPDSTRGELKRIGGSQSDEWNNILANQAVDALWLKNNDEETRDRQLNATIAAMMGVAPKDELEGMMAAQLLAAHNAAMECYRRAMIGEQTFEGRKENLNQANKLSRTYANLLEALNRHRGKGQQKMTVEHVHVHAGGQAVVGNVEVPGGGDNRRMEDQAHAKATHAPQSKMWSHDPVRGNLPVSGNEERAMQDAWGEVDWRPKGQ